MVETGGASPAPKFENPRLFGGAGVAAGIAFAACGALAATAAGCGFLSAFRGLP